jgi:hypothetical protein
MCLVEILSEGMQFTIVIDLMDSLKYYFVMKVTELETGNNPQVTHCSRRTVEKLSKGGMQVKIN